MYFKKPFNNVNLLHFFNANQIPKKFPIAGGNFFLPYQLLTEKKLTRSKKEDVPVVIDL